MPKIRDYWKRAGFAQKVALSLPVLLVALGIGVVVANVVGVVMWRIERTRILASGESLDFAEIIPQSIPDAENFCATPALMGLRLDKNLRKRERIENLVDWYAGNWRDYEIDTACASRGRRSNIREMLAYLEGASPGSYDSMPLEEAGKSLINIIRERDKHNIFDELAGVSRRMESQFIPGWEEIAKQQIRFNTPVHHLSSVQAFALTNSRRASAAVYAGDDEEFVEAVEIQIQLAKGLLREPIVISQLVGTTSLSQIISPVWERFAMGEMGEDMLGRLDASLDGINLREGFLLTMRGEMTCILDGVEAGIERPSVTDFFDGKVQKTLEEIFFRIGAAGLIRKEIGSYFNDSLITPAKRGWPEFSKSLVALDSTFISTSSRIHYLGEAKSSNAGMWHVARQIVLVKATLSCARAATGLERYFIESGSYPKALSELVPKYLAEIPTDPVTGDIIGYRKNSGDDRYVLWSVGFDLEDDGGQILPKPAEGDEYPKFLSSAYEGDWVWKYPATN